MEDSFRVRVDKVFGSLSDPVSPAQWTLTDEEIEKKEWNRDPPIHPYDDDPKPPSSSPRKPEGSKKELDDDDEDDGDDDDVPSASSERTDRHNRLRRASENQKTDEDEELEVRASIGLDCTLDYEEEEDQFDKVAVGKEKSGERLYMKDINDYDTDFNHYVTDVPDFVSDVNTFHEPVGLDDVSRDPRANHLAAKLRLEEDSEAAGGFNSLKLSETSRGMTNSLSGAEADIASPSVNIGSQDDGDGGLTNPKPILKIKRDNQSASKSLKRVRFEPPIDTTSDTIRDQNQEDQEDQEDQEASNLALTETSDTLISSSATTMDRSKYTHYTLDSSDEMDAESNRRAYTDFLNLIKKPDAAEMQLDDVFSKPPTFTSKKSSMVVNGDSKSKNDGTFPVCIAADDVQDNKASAMEEDDSPVVDRGVYKSGRQYRTKSKVDVE